MYILYYLHYTHLYLMLCMILTDVTPGMQQELESLHQYDVLWQQDLHSSYRQFLNSGPDDRDCYLQVESLLQLEEDLDAIPDAFAVGPFVLSTRPVKNSFKAWAVSWKTEFVSFLHNKAKVMTKSGITLK